VMARAGGHKEGRYIKELMIREGVTTVHFVPSMLRAMLDEDGGLKGCFGLRRVIASGEELSKELEEEYEEKSEEGSELSNLYGPTEAAVDVSYWRCERGEGGTKVPIGRPIGNIKLYVLDEGLEAVPAGVKGELMISGVGVGRGYYKRPEVTAEKYIPDGIGGRAGERVYRTGDVARHLGDGAIEYLGRKDNQVKVRGFRIELGEIEGALRGEEGVRDAVVVVEGERGEQRLIGYIAGEVKEGREQEIRRRLGERLPEHMVPNVIVQMERMPLLPNGKIDRKSLPKPEAVREKEYREPETPTEEALAEIWSEVLKLERVGTGDDFFEVGGNSLSATRLIAQINYAFETSLQFKDLFGNRTIAGLAALIEEIVLEESEQFEAPRA